MLRYIFTLLLSFTCFSFAQADQPNQLAALQKQIKSLEQKLSVLETDKILREQDELDNAEKYTTKLTEPIFILLLSASFCSLWAQYTRRSSILWFILGLAPPVLIILLCKSSNDLNKGRMKPWNN